MRRHPRLIGFPISIITGRTTNKRSHAYRYVLRNRATGDAYLVIVFSLHLKEDVNEDGSLKPAALKTGQGDPDVAMEKADRVDEGSGEVKGDEEGERGNSDDVD